MLIRSRPLLCNTGQTATRFLRYPCCYFCQYKAFSALLSMTKVIDISDIYHVNERIRPACESDNASQLSNCGENRVSEGDR
jgi:hypothetical protein